MIFIKVQRYYYNCYLNINYNDTKKPVEFHWSFLENQTKIAFGYAVFTTAML